jgi:hypothetical protein
MIAVVRSDLYRLFTIRSSAVALAVLGAATAAIVRRAVPLVVGFGVWVIFIEAMFGKMEQPLPFSAYLDAATGNVEKLLILLGWTLAAVLGALVAVHRDLNGD